MKSPSKNVLNTLHKLACGELDLAAETMAKAKKVFNEAEEKGKALRSYKKDYLSNLNKLLQQGLGKEQHINYHNFLNKLDQAILGQDEIIIAAEYEFKKQREVLQEAQRKKMSYEVLLKRVKKKEHIMAVKKDRKMMDEHVVRSRRSHFI